MRSLFAKSASASIGHDRGRLGLVLLSTVTLMSCIADPGRYAVAELTAQEWKGAQCTGAAIAKYDDLHSKANSHDKALAEQSVAELPAAKAKLEQDIAWLVARGLVTVDRKQGPRGAAVHAIVSAEVERIRQAVSLCRASTDDGSAVPEETKAICRMATACAQWTPDK